MACLQWASIFIISLLNKPSEQPLGPLAVPSWEGGGEVWTT